MPYEIRCRECGFRETFDVAFDEAMGEYVDLADGHSHPIVFYQTETVSAPPR